MLCWLSEHPYNTVNGFQAYLYIKAATPFSPQISHRIPIYKTLSK